MKVWIIKIDDVGDYETYPHDVEIFAKGEDAKKRFDEIVAEAKADFLEEDHRETEESETYYESWLDGWWSKDHYGVYLKSAEVQ